MSKSLKDRIAFFTHHQKLPGHYYQKEKHLFSFDEIPQDVKDATYKTTSGYLAPIINRHSQTSRGMKARMKSVYRRQERAQNKTEHRQQVNSY